MTFVSLLPPTAERVQAAADEFDRDNQLTEEALAQVVRAFPTNAVPAHVFLKAVLLNNLYKTRIRDIDLEPVARRIASLAIDPLLRSGSLNAVDLVRNCGEMKKPYSFATKFCCWHNPVAYPIYDANADKCLWEYKKQDLFAKFKRQDLKIYEKYVVVVSAFRTSYSLERFNFRELDKFLWKIGGQLLRVD